MTKAELGPFPPFSILIRSGREVAKKHSPLIFIITVALVIAGLAGLSMAVAYPNVKALASPAAPGIYQLSFLGNNPTPPPDFIPLINNSLPVGQELILQAHVTDSSGHPAMRGSVIFQSCHLKGNPAPSEACVSAMGAWSHIITTQVDQNGNAGVDFGFVSNPRTIGFRFEYIGQGSGIANGASGQGDVTWF